MDIPTPDIVTPSIITVSCFGCGKPVQAWAGSFGCVYCSDCMEQKCWGSRIADDAHPWWRMHF